MDRLYELMPVVYRRRDIKQRYALRALFDAFQEQFDILHADIGALYDNWFAETCEPWLLPYIAELVSVTRLPAPSEGDPRRLTVNALAYRRRKGTVATAGAYASDVTGWAVRAVDYAALVLQTVNVFDVNTGGGKSVDVSAIGALDALETWQETTAHGFHVSERYTLRDVGLFVWRIKSLPVERAQPRWMSQNCYTFDPTGVDTPLFSRVDDTTLDVPQPITPEHLRDLLLLAVQSSLVHRLPFSLQTSGDDVSAEQMIVADLSDWQFPAYAREDVVAVDPVRGRFRIGPTFPAEIDSVTYCYGSLGSLGGGSYPRRADTAGHTEPVWTGTIGSASAGQLGIYGSIGGALAAATAAGTRVAVLEIIDSASYDESLTLASAGKSSQRIVIRARLGQRPSILGDIDVSAADGEYVRATLDGLRIGGVVRTQGAVNLDIVDTTIVPQAGTASLTLDGAQSGAQISLRRSICGAVVAETGQVAVVAVDSVVDGVDSPAVQARGVAEVTLDALRSTFFGAVIATEVRATDSLIGDGLQLDRPRQSDAAFCGLPADTSDQIALRSCIFPSVAPESWFISRRFGDAGYAGLGLSAPAELFDGASDGMVVGAFHELGLPVRQRMLRAAGEAMIPYGLTLRVQYET